MNNFNVLPLPKKAEILLRNGQRLASICVNGITESLYTLDRSHNYVFVELLLAKNGQIIDIRQLNISHVGKFVDQININIVSSTHPLA